MTVALQTPVNTYTYAGAPTFAYAFQLLDQGDLVLSVNGVTLAINTDYTVSGVGDQSGGLISLTASRILLMVNGDAVEARRVMQRTRSTAYESNGDLPSATLNQDLDRAVLMLQEDQVSALSALRAPNGEILPMLPSAAVRASTILGFDSLGNPIGTIPASGSAADVLITLADSTAPSKGAGAIGFLYSLAYGAGTIGAWLKGLVGSTGSSFIGWIQGGTGAVTRLSQAKMREQMVSVADFGAAMTGLVDDSAAWLAAKTYAASLKRPLFIPNGTHLVGAQVLNDLRISLIGESVLGTIVQAPAGFTGTLVSMLNTGNNGGDTFERIENLTLQGVFGTGSVGIDRALVSRGSIRNVRVQRFDIGIRSVNTFCDYGQCVEVNDCRTDWHFVGSNHNSEYVRCSAIGFGNSWGGAGTGIKIENNGADSLQSSLAFRGCDIEFGSGDATSIACTGTVLFDNVYMEAVGGTMLNVLDGHVDVLGGEYIIKDSTGFLCAVVGGGASVTFDDESSITSDGTTRVFASIIKTGGAGTVSLLRSRIFEKLITTNVGTLPPNLGRGVLSAPFLKPAGRQFTKTDFTGVSTVTTTGDVRRVACTTAGAVSLFQPFLVAPRINANCALVIVYKSNQTFQVTSVAASGQTGTVTTIGTLPNSASAQLIAVFPAAHIVDSTQTGIEFWRPSWAIGDFLEITELWWYDGGAILNGQLSLG